MELPSSIALTQYVFCVRLEGQIGAESQRVLRRFIYCPALFSVYILTPYTPANAI